MGRWLVSRPRFIHCVLCHMELLAEGTKARARQRRLPVARAPPKQRCLLALTASLRAFRSSGVSLRLDMTLTGPAAPRGLSALCSRPTLSSAAAAAAAQRASMRCAFAPRGARNTSERCGR